MRSRDSRCDSQKPEELLHTFPLLLKVRQKAPVSCPGEQRLLQPCCSADAVLMGVEQNMARVRMSETWKTSEEQRVPNSAFTGQARSQ